MFVVNKAPNSIAAEAYRALRTSIKYSSVDKKIKTIVITSSISGEGKSTVVGNLAFTLSEAGAKVLIIDCDLRRPTIHRNFSVSNSFGLTDILIEKNLNNKCVKNITKNLSIITSGSIPPNPSEILSSQAFSSFIGIMKENYDYILLDTTPVLAVTDAEELAGKCDGTIVVARANKTKEKLLKRSYERLQAVNANVIGSVLTDTKISKRDSSYYYYGDNKRKRK